jgi:hypothetical protein
VRFVENHDLAAVDARPIEQLEFDLEECATCTGTDEAAVRGIRRYSLEKGVGDEVGRGNGESSKSRLEETRNDESSINVGSRGSKSRP